MSSDIYINNRDDWDKAWQQVVALYWVEFDDLWEAQGLSVGPKAGEERNVLLYLLNKLGVKNVGCAGVEGKKYSVKFYYKNLVVTKQDKIPHQKNDESNVNVMVVATFPNDEGEVRYRSNLAYTTTNGWEGLWSSLEIKIPFKLDFGGFKMPIPYLFEEDMNDSLKELKELKNISRKNEDVIDLICEMQGVTLTVLSDYIRLGSFFPFGFDMQDSSGLLDSSFGPVKVTSEIWTRNNIEMAKVWMEKIEPSEKGDSFDKSFGGCSKHGDLSAGATTLSEAGDRGGAEGLTDDYGWEQFVPRMVSYVWAHSRGESVKDASLLDHKAMLYDLGYRIPNGVGVSVKPVDVKVDDDGNFKIKEVDFYSTLEVVIPAPPASNYQPIALSDFIAVRSNEPFTSV
ncbi:MAG: hypothetical protein COB04_11660 [Gammaproteobacteria bacterium]|nr:MAG: hypothetical protein COB04_11660 [Gammaproteobacteria bacterium]